jgi:hypothetical protein
MRKVTNLRLVSILALAVAGGAALQAGCMDTAPDADESVAQGSTVATEEGSPGESKVLEDVHDNGEAAASDSPNVLAVSCITHVGHTAGWAECIGSGTVRIRLDCNAQSDFVGQWTAFNGSVTLRGECRFRCDGVTYEVR